VGSGETPSHCILVTIPRTRTPLTWLQVGTDGGSVFVPSLSNLVHLILRTGVLRFRFPPLVFFLRGWHSAISGLFIFFLIAETEKRCEEGGESQDSRLPSSRSAVAVGVEMGTCPCARRRAVGSQPSPSSGALRHLTRVASNVQCVDGSGVPWLLVSLVIAPFPPPQSRSTPRCISSDSVWCGNRQKLQKPSRVGKICFTHSSGINLLL